MGKLLINVGTITYAMKGREILARYGIPAYIEKTTATDKKGCGYVLYTPNRYEDAYRILIENGIKIIDNNKGDEQW